MQLNPCDFGFRFRTPMMLLICGLMVLSGVTPIHAEDLAPAVSLVQKYCINCHGEKKQEGGLRFDKLTGNLARHSEEATTWTAMLQQLQAGTMPPENNRRPADGELAASTEWIRQNVSQAERLWQRKLMRPENGNLINHDQLFNPKIAAAAPEIAASPARIWRTLAESYADQQRGWLRAKGAVKVKGDQELPAPFGLHPEHELKNYSALYTLEASQTEGLANNARSLLIRMIDGDPENERSLLRKLALAKTPPAQEDLDKLISELYRHWLGREPEKAELTEKRNFVLKNITTFGNREGLIYGLVPILAHPEVFFHQELGASITDATPVMLSPLELADALDRALRDRRGNGNDLFARLAQQGKLNSRADVLAALENMKPQQLSRAETVHRFLEEYFIYPHSFHVFKCPEDLKQQQLQNPLFQGFDSTKTFGRDKTVGATRQVIDIILEEDRHVLQQLLTVRTDYMGKSNAVLSWEFHSKITKTQATIERLEQELAGKNEKQLSTERHEKVVEELRKRKTLLAEFLEERRNPKEIGPDRIGILTQRSWLVAHSTNAENHAIHRGKWIRERLLGGRIPDVPITVDAALPENPTKTLRERMAKTRQMECWKCHRLMDPLGLPFEQYDHFGSFREQELGKPVVTAGEILESGDPELDGAVNNPRELLDRLAKSERVQQVFVRYAFRFWMGRNETLDDACTIQNAYNAYQENEGSMSALLKSLLTSDAFLYRTGAGPLEENSHAN